MPIIYLSPSTQEWNYYVNGGTEEEYMNLLADKMVPYLDASAGSPVILRQALGQTALIPLPIRP